MTPYCWKGCGTRGTFFHAWWSCPIIIQFWTQILKEVNKITKCQIPLSPKIILLNLWEEIRIPTYLQDLIAILFTAAKTLLAAKWKSIKMPTLQEWLNKTWDYFVFDKIMLELEHVNSERRKSHFVKRWSPFVQVFVGHTNFSKINILSKSELRLIVSH